jgi:signal transduction histidine kinase
VVRRLTVAGMASIALRHGLDRWESRRASIARVAVGVVAVAVCAGATVIVGRGSATDADEWLEQAVLETLTIGLPIAAGLYATCFARTLRFGVLLIGAGFVWALTTLAETSESLPYSIGRVAAWLIFPIVAYLMLAYPEGRIAQGIDRRVFAGVLVVIAVLYIGSALLVEAYPLHTPWTSCTTDCPPNAFFVLDTEPAFMADVVGPLREALGVLLFVAVSASLLRRWRVAAPVRRLTLGPLLVVSIVFTTCLGVYLVLRRVAPDAGAVTTIGLIWTLTVPGIAAAFLIGLVRRHLMVGHVLTRISLGLSPLDPRELRDTLADALDDAGIEVLTPAEQPGRWRDTEGHITSASPVDGQHILTTIEDADGIAAALVHDPTLEDDEELLDAVRSLILATLEHQRVTGRLVASLTELEDSRARIARAADLERSRIERDLHDGAQQRLIGLRIKLSLAEELAQSNPAAGMEAVHELGTEVDLTLEELRSLARGVYPSLLHDRGLVDSLRSAMSDSPLPVHVVTQGLTRQPLEVETAVYFACLEASQNAIKHARGATGLWISLWQDRVLRFEVRDDGGGFIPGTGTNGGMRNMRDRVESVGGRLTIDSAPGDGTRILGAVPLQDELRGL